MADKRLDDGFKCTIVFGAYSTAAFEEKDVTPPGVDGGGPINVTSMRNTRYRTFKPKTLITLDDSTFMVSYKPSLYSDIIAHLLNVNNLITITFSDTSTLAFYGWLNSFKPGRIVEGVQPEAAIQIIPSNIDNTGAEFPPSLTFPP